MPQVAPQATGFAVDSPMVPGEVVVWVKSGKRADDLLSTDYQADFELVRGRSGPVAVLRAFDAMGKSSLRDGARLEDSYELATCRAADRLAAHADIVCTSPNYLLRPFVEPNDQYYPLQWHYQQVQLPQTWDITQGSADVIVAVLDTGIVSAHPEFAGRLIGGYDMISNPQNAGDGDGRDPNPEDTGDLQSPQGSSFHGTHVAGTIGANGNDGQGVAGVDWNCRLMNVRVLGRGVASTDDIANGILFAAGLPNGSGALPPQRADIVNMSLGGPGLNPVLEQACNAAANAGVLLIAAAGNDNVDQPNSPAAFASVLSVGAVDLIGQRAPYSNFSPTIDIWAPGGDMSVDRNGDGQPDGVLSTLADDQGNLFYNFLQGTSMACPHVAGVAALIKAADPTLTASQIRDILVNSATGGQQLPNGGRLLDALAAVQAASGAVGNSPLLVASPPFVDFGADATALRVELQNRGAGDLVFQGFALSQQADWLDGSLTDAISGNGLDGDQLDLTADRTGLANGVYQAVLTLAYDNAGTAVAIDLTIRLQVGQSTVSDDTVFVLLVDPSTLESKFETQTSKLANFSFSVSGVQPGVYLLAAGTDRDNDDLLGDDGELFGVYPSLDQPIAIEVIDGSQLGALNFPLQEVVTLNSLGSGGVPGGRILRRLR